MVACRVSSIALAPLEPRLTSSPSWSVRPASNATSGPLAVEPAALNSPAPTKKGANLKKETDLPLFDQFFLFASSLCFAPLPLNALACVIVNSFRTPLTWFSSPFFLRVPNSHTTYVLRRRAQMRSFVAVCAVTQGSNQPMGLCNFCSNMATSMAVPTRDGKAVCSLYAPNLAVVRSPEIAVRYTRPKIVRVLCERSLKLLDVARDFITFSLFGSP